MKIITNEVKQLAITKASKLGFVFNPSGIGQIQNDTALDDKYNHAISFLYDVSGLKSSMAYNLITDVEVSKHTDSQNIRFKLPYNGNCEVQGDFYFNKNLKRFEHDVIDSDGCKYLAIWK